MNVCLWEFAVELSHCCRDWVGFVSDGREVVSFAVLATRDSQDKCSDVLLWLVMVFLFEEKQLSCLHNKSSWHGMRCNCVGCEQCDLPSSLSPRKVALFSGFFSPPFCIVQWIFHFCLCCNLYNTQIYSHTPAWSNTTRKLHHTDSHVPERKKWAKGRPFGSQTGHPWAKQRRGPKLCSGACFSHLSSVFPCSLLNLD